jgi:hypothetical protein
MSVGAAWPVVAVLLGALVSPGAGQDREVLQSHGVHLAPVHAASGARWTPELVADLRAGLERLPEPMRRFPGGPLVLELHGWALPYGMGDGTERRPDWTGGRRRFHLYAIEPSAEPLVEARLAALDASQRASLWRQRAIVHAIVTRWDDALGLARRPAWRRLNGWLLPFERPFTWQERPLNLYVGAYSRARGLESASLDLVTWAEEHFVPAEAFVPASSPDDATGCRELSKTRVLQVLLAEAGLAGPAARPADCPAFDAWASPTTLSHWEVLLVAASGRRPESLFGHVLLQPVRQPDERVEGPSFRAAVQVAAITDGPEAGLRYLVRGVFGGYWLTVSTPSRGDLERELLHQEQRTIRRYRLNLTEAQNLRLLERVWDLERRGYFNYQFFTDNCASLLVAIIESVLDEEIRVPIPGWFVVAPFTVLDGLARVQVETPAGRRPLVTPIPEDVESSGARARRAEGARLRAEAEILAALPASARADVAEQLERVRDRDPARRAEGYQRLAALSRAAPVEADEALYRWWASSVRVERYALDRAENAWQLTDARTVLPEALPPPDPDREVRLRQTLFERESRLRQGRLILDRREERAERIRRAPRRELSEEELAIRALAAATAESFATLTDLHGELVEARFGRFDPAAWLEAERARRVEEQALAVRRSLQGSGAWRAALGPGWRWDRSGAAQPVVVLRTAAMAHHLGDQRGHGMGPASELRLLDGELVLGRRGWRPETVASELTLIAYRSLQRELPMFREGLFSHFGWGFSTGLEQRPASVLPHRARAQFELLPVLEAGDRFERFTTVGLGAAWLVGWGEKPTAGGGPRLLLAQRLPLFGHSANALRLEASYGPMLLAKRQVEVLHEGRASLELNLLFGGTEGFAVLVSPRASLALEKSGAGPWAGEVVGSIGIELR